MKISDIILNEGDVIKNKFGTKQQQKNKQKYQYNDEIAQDIPQYDRRRRASVAPEFASVVSQPEDLEPFDHFVAKDINDQVAQLIGITQDGRGVQVSTGHAQLIHALADAYNRGGFTDQDLKKVKLDPEDLD